MRNRYSVHFINPFPGGYKQSWNGYGFTEEDALKSAEPYARGREMVVQLLETGEQIWADIRARERADREREEARLMKEELARKEAGEKEVARIAWLREFRADQELKRKQAKIEEKRRLARIDKANVSVNLSIVAGRFAMPVDDFYMSELEPSAFIAYA